MAENHHFILQDNPGVGSVEAFRTLQTNLHFASLDQDTQVVGFTSATPGEGKSTVAVNTAVGMAQSGAKVVVVDCNLRSPAVHAICQCSQEQGLTSVLTQARTLEQVLQQTRVDGLKVLSSGPLPANPVDLLRCTALDELFSALRQQADSIIVDATSVLPVVDALVLGRLVDGMVLVVGARSVSRDAVSEAERRLAQARVNMLGAVFNGVQREPRSRY